MLDNEIHEIPVKDILVSDFNVRQHGRDRDVDELADSIKKHGLLQPVVLLGKFGDKTPYKLISGQRRLLAHEKLEKETIKAVFVGKLDRTQSLVRSLVENLQRLDLDYEDTANVITELYIKFDKDERKIAKETGLSLRKVRDYVRIESMANDAIRAKLKAGSVSAADVKRAFRAAQNDLKKAETILNLFIKHKPTAYQKKRVVELGQKKKNADAATLMNEALEPRLEETIVVALPEELKAGLKQASKLMQLDPEDLTIKVLQEWLYEKGFITRPE